MVPALKKGDVDCISAGHEGTDFWMLVWNIMDKCTDAGFNIRAHTTLEEKAKMTLKSSR